MGSESGRRREREAFGAAAAFALTLVAAGPAARAADLHGRLELRDAVDFSARDSLAAALGAAQANDALASLRLIWEPVQGAWRLSVHGVLAVETSPEIRLARGPAATPPPPPPTLFELTGTTPTRGATAATGAFDRLSLAWSGPSTVVRVGRQALTIGGGLVFRPMDLFDPFSPTAVDTEYKPGADMVYAQRLFADGSDLQLIVVPRPARAGGPPAANDSSAALVFQTRLAGRHTTWLLARDHGDWVGALGVNGSLGGATWTLEAVPTAVRRGGVRLSALANLSDAVTLAGRNATVFAEYFRNGFGVIGPASIADLPADLSGRLARGQVFDVRRDYLAAGATIEINPLLTAGPTLIANLDDGSLFLIVGAAWSLGDNLSLTAGVQAPVGSANSEFGGLPRTAVGRVRVTAPTRGYLQLRRYF